MKETVEITENSELIQAILAIYEYQRSVELN